MDETIEYIPQWKDIDEHQFDALVAELDGLFEGILRDQVLHCQQECEIV